MSTIITATDYSDIANHAVHYACNMALAYDKSVTVIHSFIIPVVIGTDTPMPAISIEEARNISEERMTELIKSLQQSYPGIDINSHITYGDITDSLQEYCETVRPWLIVVGNSSSEESNFWPGSNLINALKELHFNVLAVPPETTFKKIEKLCFACDLKNTSEKLSTDQLTEIVAVTNAKLSVLNVYHNPEDRENAINESGVLKQMLSSLAPEFHFINSKNIDEGIMDFATENAMDWLIIIPHKHGFFESLIHRSHTKAMARMSHIPLLALHDK